MMRAAARRGATVAMAMLVVLSGGCRSVLGIDEPTDLRLADAGTGPEAVSCSVYCSVVQKNCTAANQVYLDAAECSATCADLPLGNRGDDSGNSIGCRLHYAEAAGTAGERDMNCSAAGPGGNGICGTNCDGFCSIVQKACSGTYATDVACKGACAELPDLGNYNDAIPSGDSVQCRLYFVSAATIDPALQCLQTDVARAGSCGAAR